MSAQSQREPANSNEFEPGFVFRTYDAAEAVDKLNKLNEAQRDHLREQYEKVKDASDDELPSGPIRGFYGGFRFDIARSPQIKTSLDDETGIDKRLAWGALFKSGRYQITVPYALPYHEEQIAAVIENNQTPVQVYLSEESMPVEYAIGGALQLPTWKADLFHETNFEAQDEGLRLGDFSSLPKGTFPLGWYNATRVEHAQQHFRHYTGTSHTDMQPYVVFVNYAQFMYEIAEYALESLKGDFDHEAEPWRDRYTELVVSGGKTFKKGEIGDLKEAFLAAINASEVTKHTKNYQMPSLHLKTADGEGITFLNIGVSATNTLTAVSHVAPLRPKAWAMLGHIGAWDITLGKGDIVMPTKYLVDHGVMRDFLPPSHPITTTPELHVLSTQVVKELFNLESDYDSKTKVRNGAVICTDQRVNDLLPRERLFERYFASKPIGQQMEGSVVGGMGDFHGIPHFGVYFVTDNMQASNKAMENAQDYFKRRKAIEARVPIRIMERLAGMPLTDYYGRATRATIMPPSEHFVHQDGSDFAIPQVPSTPAFR